MADYNVPKLSPLFIAAPAKKEFLSAIYGVGIRLAEENQENSKNRLNQYSEDVVSNYSSESTYDPDATPDGNGGYSPNSRWSGELSSVFGLPVMCYLKIIGGTYIDLQGNEQEIPDIIFETVVMTVTMNKETKKTQITGRNTGSIKEYIGLGDWDVEIRVIISADAPVNENVIKRNQEGVYPRDNMAEIMKALRAPIALPVECWYLDQFGIKYLCIEPGVQIQQIEGEYSNQRLVIPACSDNPLVIKIAKR